MDSLTYRVYLPVPHFLMTNKLLQTPCSVAASGSATPQLKAPDGLMIPNTSKISSWGNEPQFPVKKIWVANCWRQRWESGFFCVGWNKHYTDNTWDYFGIFPKPRSVAGHWGGWWLPGPGGLQDWGVPMWFTRSRQMAENRSSFRPRHKTPPWGTGMGQGRARMLTCRQAWLAGSVARQGQAVGSWRPALLWHCWGRSWWPWGWEGVLSHRQVEEVPRGGQGQAVLSVTKCHGRMLGWLLVSPSSFGSVYIHCVFWPPNSQTMT